MSYSAMEYDRQMVPIQSGSTDQTVQAQRRLNFLGFSKKRSVLDEDFF